MSDPLDAFHSHLDVCQRCREQVFNLCPVGVPLFKAAGRQITPRPEAGAALLPCAHVAAQVEWAGRKSRHGKPLVCAACGAEWRDDGQGWRGAPPTEKEKP